MLLPPTRSDAAAPVAGVMSDGAVSGGAVRFVANELAAREAIGQVVEGLGAQEVEPDLLGPVEIVLAEVINNVVEHAYAGMEPGEAGIEYGVDEDGLWLSFWDRGKGFPRGRLPPGNVADLLVPREELPEGGFGWFLIRSLAQGIRFERTGGVNRLHVRFGSVDEGTVDDASAIS